MFVFILEVFGDGGDGNVTEYPVMWTWEPSINKNNLPKQPWTEELRVIS